MVEDAIGEEHARGGAVFDDCREILGAFTGGDFFMDPAMLAKRPDGDLADGVAYLAAKAVRQRCDGVGAGPASEPRPKRQQEGKRS
ncbi:hypothetical protein WMF30_53330 [Sorangium sp. So ce134]